MSEYLKVAFFGIVWIWCGVTTLLAYMYAKEQEKRLTTCAICGCKVKIVSKEGVDWVVCKDCDMWEKI